MKENNFKYIDSFEVMNLLKISRNTLRTLIKRNIIQVHRLPHLRKRFFDRDQIQSILDQNIITENHRLDT